METEPNDSIATASAMTLGTATIGQLSSETDKDYFQVTVSSAGVLTLSFDVPTDQSTWPDYFRLGLYDGDGTLLNQFKTGADKIYQAAVSSAGTYYLAVDTPDGYYNSNSYSLTVERNARPTGSVTIGGTTKQGFTLTANNSVGDLDGLGTITYTWKADGTIIGTGSTYQLTKAEVGKLITATASYTDGYGRAESVSSIATSTVLNVNDLPTGIVTISGTPIQGETLSASNSLSDADGLGTITYTWKADGTTIGTASTYLLTQDEVGKVITATASYTDDFGTNESAVSDATSLVANLNDPPTGSVTISGLAQRGETLTASNSLADIDGLGSITYTWKANGNTIGTADTFVLTQTELGKTISATATYIDQLNTPENVDSNSILVPDLFYHMTSRGFTGTNGSDLVWGTIADDVISAGAGNDDIFGDAGSDLLTGGLGADIQDGGEGSDIYLATSATDLIGDVFNDTGALGTDQIRYTATVAGTLTILNSIVGIENIVIGTGTAMSAVTTDTTAININASALSAGIGIIGNAGANVLTGGTGNDTLTGNAGIDTFTISSGTDSVVDLGNGGIDVLKVSSGATVNATISAAWTASAATFNLGTANILTSGLAVNLAAVTTTVSTKGLNITNTGAATTLTGSALGDTLTGANGNDSLVGGAGNDSLSGSAGIDILTGDAGADSMNGGDGSDIYLVTSAADIAGDVFADTGSSGTDELRYASTASVTLTITNSLSGIERIVVGTGTAALAVTTGTTAISVNASALTSGIEIIGNAGANTLTGGSGADTLTGNAGVDTFNISSGTDTIADLGKGGADVLKVSAGATANATTGAPWTASSATTNLGAVSIMTSGFAVNLAAVSAVGSTAGFSVTNAGLATTLTGSALSDTLAGGTGNDSLFGGLGSDTLSGGAGNDVLIGGAAADSLNGGEGSDIYVVSVVGDLAGDIYLDTGIGLTNRDELRYAVTTAGTLTVTDDLIGIEAVAIGTGTAAAAVVTGTTPINVDASTRSTGIAIIGNAGINILTGGIGNDSLTGNAGNDSLVGNAGDDLLVGGAGADAQNGGEGSDLYVINLSSEYATGEVIADTGTTGTDELRFAALASSTLTLAASLSGIENIVVGTGMTSTAVTTGTLSINVNAAALAAGVSITGNNGSNILTGGSGADQLVGNAGKDMINGGLGDDTVIGGVGADSLNGGAGSDTFVFAAGDTGQLTGFDLITGFEKGAVGIRDVIDYTVDLKIGGSAAPATSAQASINALTGVATFAASSGTTLTDALADVASGLASAGEFALFRVANMGSYYLYVSDGVVGLGTNDLLIQLVGITAIGSIDVGGGNMTVLS